MVGSCGIYPTRWRSWAQPAGLPSTVTVPDGKGGFVADFTSQADAALQKFADAGMHLVTSTTPIASWPGLRL